MLNIPVSIHLSKALYVLQVGKSSRAGIYVMTPVEQIKRYALTAVSSCIPVHLCLAQGPSTHSAIALVPNSCELTVCDKSDPCLIMCLQPWQQTVHC